MEISNWQKLFVEAVHKKYPKLWTPEQRLLGITRQVSDVSNIIQYGGENLNHKIACLLPDFFMLCEHCKVDLDGELKLVLEWFQSDGKRRAEETTQLSKISEIVKSWNIKDQPEYRAYKCGKCLKDIDKAWHVWFEHAGFKCEVHFCNDCYETIK